MTFTPSKELLTKHELYLSLLPTQQDGAGFIETNKCDSLLFSALLSCVPGTNVMICAAEGEDGEWFRRPRWPLLGYEECYTSGNSTSTISKDMLVGLAWNAWVTGNHRLAESVCDYALSHFGIMGRGNLSQTLISPSLLNTFAHISHKLGGKSYPILRCLPVYISPNETDYKRHLAVLHALLRQKMDLPVNTIIFHRAYVKQPNNPLFFFAAHGKTYDWSVYEAIEKQLLNTRLWPADRLPDSWNRSEPWLLQRDYSEKDWGPEMYTMGPSQHSGGDFLFVSALLQGLI